MEIVRLERPTLDELRAAAEISELRWPYLAGTHGAARLAGFQRRGVELVVAREAGRLEGACFALPCRFTLGGEALEWTFLFQLATRPEARNAGALIMLRIMSLYPAVTSMGVTEDAVRMYHALRWRCHAEVWRGIHPLDVGRMAQDYGERIQRGWLRLALKGSAGAYNALARPVEMALARGALAQPLAGGHEPALQAIAAYLPVWQSQELRCVQVAGIGRIVSAFPAQAGTLAAHAALWRRLRREGAKFCEVLLTSPQARRRARRLGYLPSAMPLWYVEKNGMVSKLIAAMQRGECSFLHTDKAV